MSATLYCDMGLVDSLACVLSIHETSMRETQRNLQHTRKKNMGKFSSIYTNAISTSLDQYSKRV